MKPKLSFEDECRLVRRAKSGDQSAVAELFRHFIEWATISARRKMGALEDPTAHYDVAVDAILKTIEKFDPDRSTASRFSVILEFKLRASLRAWFQRARVVRFPLLHRPENGTFISFDSHLNHEDESEEDSRGSYNNDIEHQTSADAQLQMPEAPSSCLDAEEVTKRVEKALKRLDPASRKMMRLRFERGMTFEQIKDALFPRLSKQAVHVKFTAALLKLRACADQDGLSELRHS